MASQRNHLIDAFRGVAIIVVLIFHYAVEGMHWEPRQLFDLGARGVQLFFVISGLVITMTALRSRGPFDFVVRRFARIYPTFFVAATATFIVLCVHNPIGQHVDIKDYLLSLTFLAEQVGRHFVDGAYWSLLVEVQFYVLVALSLLFLREKFWVGVLAVLVFGGLVRPISKAVAAGLFSSYSSFFLIGMAAWYGIVEKNHRAGLILAIGAAFTYLVGPQVVIQWPALIPTAIFLCMLSAGVNSSLGPLAWIGRISYPLYLLHQVLGLVIIADLQKAGAPDPLAFVLAFVAMVVLAAGAHIWIEEPSQRIAMSWWKKLHTPAVERAPLNPAAETEIVANG